MYQNPTHKEPNSNKIGILLTNLGTPDAPNKQALKVYLKEFLSDSRVVEPPPARWLWKLILHGVILNIRPKKSAKAYQSIWGRYGTGSPLLDMSKRQTQAISKALGGHSSRFVVALGMRYGNPSISHALEILEKNNCNKILLLPLYPQYAGATTGSTFDAISNELKTWRRVPELRFINGYHAHNLYIESLANSVREFEAENGKPDLLLMSYHGIPKRYFVNGDYYPCACCQTTHLLAKKLNLDVSSYQMSFQSRFGTEPWMGDYTDDVLKLLPQKGIKHVQVICPGFAADCLETLEEIEVENKAYFLAAGGVSYQYIPALNDQVMHIHFLTELIKSKTTDWYEN